MDSLESRMEMIGCCAEAGQGAAGLGSSLLALMAEGVPKQSDCILGLVLNNFDKA